MLRPGTVIDQRYRIVRPLGEGGYGAVYLAEELNPHDDHSNPEQSDRIPLRAVAIKVLNRLSTDDARFRGEIAALCRLQHPGIVAMYASGRAPVPWLAMEYVEGWLLSERQALAEQYSERARIRQLVGIAEALAHAHERGVVHRDLKPQNVLVDTAGRARVVDFGLAWLLSPDEDAQRRLGTPGYLAPELIEPGSAYCDHRADIYSLGATIHAAFAGRTPFSVGTLNGTVRHQLDGVFTLDDAMPSALRGLVTRCIARDPAQRPANCWEIADDLRRLLNDRRGVYCQDTLTPLHEAPINQTRIDILDARVAELEPIEHPQRGRGLRFRLDGGSMGPRVGAWAWLEEGGHRVRDLARSLTTLREGSEVNIFDAIVVQGRDGERFIMLDEHSVPVVEPHIPITVTDVARTHGLRAAPCGTRALVDLRQARSSSRHIVLGSIAHDMLAYLVRHHDRLDDRRAFAEAFVDSLRRQKLAAVAAGLTDEDLPELQRLLAEHFNHLRAWAATHGGQLRSAEALRISTRYGLEGRIDLAFERDGTLEIVELKTGRWQSVEHERQVRCYALMWERPARERGLETRATLVYSASGAIRPLPLRRAGDERQLLHARNAVMGMLLWLADGPGTAGASGLEAIAPPLPDEDRARCSDDSCRFRRQTCVAQHRLLNHNDSGPLAPPGLTQPPRSSGDLDPLRLADDDLTARARLWHRHFSALAAREYLSAGRALGDLFRPGTVDDRIERLRAIPDARLEHSDPEAGTTRFAAPNPGVFSAGDLIIAHRGDADDSTFLTGTVERADEASVTIRTDAAPMAPSLGQEGWILDHRTLRIGHAEAQRALTGVLQCGRRDLLQTLLDAGPSPATTRAAAGAPARTAAAETGNEAPDDAVHDVLHEVLSAQGGSAQDDSAPDTGDTGAGLAVGAGGPNEEQRLAIDRALRSDGAVLIQGPPGTGKTTVIAELVAALVSAGQTVLLCAATNTAVDNMLARVLGRGVRSALRVGRPGDRGAALDGAMRTLGLSDEQVFTEALAAGAPSLAILRQKLADTSVYAATAHAVIASPVFEVLAATRAPDSEPLCEPLFDVAIVDEATQLTEPMSLGPLLRARRFVLVGDQQQLPPVVAAAAARGANLHGVHPTLAAAGVAGLDRSLFERLSARIEPIVLRRQYRMTAAVQEFPNRSFYGGRLVSERPADDAGPGVELSALRRADPEMARRLDPTRGTVWVDVNGPGVGQMHPQEAAELARTAAALLAARRAAGSPVTADTLGVITPFRAQVRLLRQALQDTLGSHDAQLVEVDTVERFQGREKDVILLSLVTRAWSEFVFDPRRLNVTLTRARYKVVVFGARELGRRMLEVYLPDAPRPPTVG